MSGRDRLCQLLLSGLETWKLEHNCGGRWAVTRRLASVLGTLTHLESVGVYKLEHMLSRQWLFAFRTMKGSFVIVVWFVADVRPATEKIKLRAD